MIKILKVLRKSFINEDLVLNQEYILDQEDKNLFAFYRNESKIKFRGSISKLYKNDNELVIYLTDDMGGIIAFSVI